MTQPEKIAGAERSHRDGLTQTWYCAVPCLRGRVATMSIDDNPIATRVRALESSGRHVAKITWPEWSAEHSFRCLLVLGSGTDLEKVQFGAPTWPAAERLWRSACSILEN